MLPMNMCKLPNLNLIRRRFFSGAAMFLAALASSPLVSACVVTDSIEDSYFGEEIGNFPPKIVEDSATPSNVKALILTDCVLDLSVGLVEDMDLEDRLEARWFVDGIMVAWSKLPLAEGEKFRAGPSFTYEAALYGEGVHTVLLIVSDGFAEGRDLKAAAEGKAKDSILWSLDSSRVSCGALASDGGEDEPREQDDGDAQP